MMKRTLLILGVLSLAACANQPKAQPPAPQSPSPLPAAGAASEAPHALTPEQAQQIQRAEALREEGLRLLYAKDPRVKNPKLAFAKLLESANLGDPLAMDSVGGLYSSGQGGLEKSCPKAMEWFERSASSGYGLAANNLAYLYVTCQDKKLRDPAKAETILRMMFANNPSLIAVLDTYAALLAEQKSFPQAVNTMKVVIDLQELIEANPERIDESKHALGLYLKRKKLDVGFDAKPETDTGLE